MGKRRIRVRTQGIRVGTREIKVGMRGIRLGMRIIGVVMLGVEWNRNRKKRRKKNYKIQFSFFPEIEKKNRN